LRQRFLARFQEPNLHARLLSRVVLGRRVIDHEEVTRTFPEGTGSQELVMIYEVQHGRIARAWSIAGEKKLRLMVGERSLSPPAPGFRAATSH
jgi:hypothetical protein